mgnify:CR=1 FL=1
MSSKVIYWFILAVAVFICCALFSPVIEAVFFQTRGLEPAAAHWFSMLCHQDPSRSYHIAGVCLPVCTRCTGLYIGFLAAWTLWGLVPQERRDRPVSNLVLFAGIAPLCMDGLLNLAGIINSHDHFRFITGLVFGAVAARSLWPALLETVPIVKSLFNKGPVAEHEGQGPKISEAEAIGGE